MWSATNEKSGSEVSKCRHRIVSYLKGVGLDLGCGDEKICPSALGIDIRSGKNVDIQIDLSANDSLSIFSDGYFDYIFSAHVLEDFKCTDAVLTEWWRKVKVGGYLILYGPDPDFYPRIGTPGSNVEHKRDLYWQDVWKILKGFGNAKKIHASRHNDSNEYSWLLVVQKKFDYLKKVQEMIFNRESKNGRISFPRKKKAKKECLIVRYGAIGDAIWATPVLRKLKQQGYYIVYNCTPYSAQVLKHNPNIDEFLIQEKNAIPNQDLGEYWKTIGASFDKFINLSQSVERKLLRVEGSDEYRHSHKRRHKDCNYNYQDATMEAAGFGECRGEQPELHFTEMEESLAKVLRNNNKDKFLIIWALSGSSLHKIYPWSPYIAGELDHNHDDIRIITVGDYLCKILEWQMSNTKNCAGNWTIRQAMVMTKYADLVVGPETGVLNAASCYDTPKIVFLSHSSEENLTKYWRNVHAMKPKGCSCYPCHRLIYTDACPKGPKTNESAKCAELIDPKPVYDVILSYYKKWKDKNGNSRF
ncbi:MAG: methyltransferase domain-containing protein [Phycisphaerales bacterium]|jgi:ADP-heptose:LPS heptosyltransferase